MKKLIYLIMVCICSPGYGQSLFQKWYGEYPYAHVVQTTDSGFILLSSYENSWTQYWDALVIKTDADGDTLWTKSFSKPYCHIIGFDVTPSDNDGCTIIAGFDTSTATGYDYLSIIKISASGAIIWDKFYNILNGAYIYNWASILKTFDGGYFVSTHGMASFSLGFVGMRLDAAGDTLWSRLYDSQYYLSGISQTSDSGFYVGGSAPWVQNNKFWFSKINASGAIIWAHEGQSTLQYTSLVTMDSTLDGGCIFTGTMEDTFFPAYPMAYLARVNSAGNLLWRVAYDIIGPGGGSGVQYFNDLVSTADGGFMACGGNCVLKTDSMGIPEWAYKYSFNPGQIIPTYDGGYVISGNVFDPISWSAKICLVKIDANGYSNCSFIPYAIPISYPNFIISNPAYVTPNVYPDVLAESYIVSSGASVVGFNSFCPTTGIEPVTLITGKELTIYPNPANNFININAADYHNRDILITDMLGKKLYHQCNIMLPLQINTSLFPEGMYNIKVISDEGISNKTFIITR